MVGARARGGAPLVARLAVTVGVGVPVVGTVSGGFAVPDAVGVNSGGAGAGAVRVGVGVMDSVVLGVSVSVPLYEGVSDVVGGLEGASVLFADADSVAVPLMEGVSVPLREGV